MIGKDVGELSIRNHNWKQANKIIEALTENGYACMTSLEENLIIINYVYAGEVGCHNANRNNVMFMSVDEYEDEDDKRVQELIKDIKEDYNIKD